MCREPLQRQVILDDGISRVTCPACGWIQFTSDAVDVVVVAHNGDDMVAILPPGGAGVGLPAGLVEYGEDPVAAAVREVREETELTARVVDCLGWTFVNRPSWPGPMVQIIYEAEITGRELKASEEAAAQLFCTSS